MTEKRFSFGLACLCRHLASNVHHKSRREARSRGLAFRYPTWSPSFGTSSSGFRQTRDHRFLFRRSRKPIVTRFPYRRTRLVHSRSSYQHPDQLAGLMARNLGHNPQALPVQRKQQRLTLLSPTLRFSTPTLTQQPLGVFRSSRKDVPVRTLQPRKATRHKGSRPIASPHLRPQKQNQIAPTGSWSSLLLSEARSLPPLQHPGSQ
jgi:hypothetical protein